ncbi:MAG: hypothetical protein NTV51_25065 [Verrucomicrobia bacterium]|nr:hypothetical protein [Verrucomicrobiota bacterium]
MTRTGKIARLPREVREELNRRLLDGESARRLVAWLNAQAEVRAMLDEHFDGRAIRVQSVSEWRAGGWGDWYRERQVLELAALMGEEADDFEALANGARFADRFAQASAVALMGQLRAAGAMEEGPAKLRAVLRVVAGLVRLRGSDRQWERSVREGERQEWEAAEHGLGAGAVDGVGGVNPSKADQIRPAGGGRVAEPASAGALGAGVAGAATGGVAVVGVEIKVKTGAAFGARGVNPSKSDQIRPLGIGRAVELAGAGAVAVAVRDAGVAKFARVRAMVAAEVRPAIGVTAVAATGAAFGARGVNPSKSDQIRPLAVRATEGRAFERGWAERWSGECRVDIAPESRRPEVAGHLSAASERPSSEGQPYPYPVGFEFLEDALGGGTGLWGGRARRLQDRRPTGRSPDGRLGGTSLPRGEGRTARPEVGPYPLSGVEDLIRAA